MTDTEELYKAIELSEEIKKFNTKKEKSFDELMSIAKKQEYLTDSLLTKLKNKYNTSF